jgi:short-subunit dehydrogenase
LAQQGFNIIICARNEAKIREVLKEIPTKTKCLVIDFSKAHSIRDYRESIAEL